MFKSTEYPGDQLTCRSDIKIFEKLHSSGGNESGTPRGIRTPDLLIRSRKKGVLMGFVNY
jgi:hypothetical protein